MITCSNPQCGGEFSPKDYRQRYCSRSCAAIVNNSRYPKRPSGKLKNCIVCNGDLGWNQKKYCSRKCYYIGSKSGKIKSWLSGEWSGADKNGHLSKSVRNYLLDKNNNRCSWCGWAEINPKLSAPILAVDHIDGNWKNNSIDNLRVLCYNCHTLTDTFGALNVGSGNGSGSRGGKFNSWSYGG